jgi:hypothetical protein
MAKSKSLDDYEPGETQQELSQRMATAAQNVPTVVTPRAFRSLAPGRLVAADIARNAWCVKVDPDTTKDELLRTSYWQHHIRDLRRDDEVIAMSADGSFRAHLLVRAVGPKDAAMVMLQYWELEVVTPDALDIPAGYRVDWANDISNWRASRLGEGNRWENLRDGFQTRALALAWLGEHVKAMR